MEGSRELAGPDATPSHDRLLMPLFGLIALGALSGGLVTALSLAPDSTLEAFPVGLPAALAAMALSTAGLVVTAALHLGLRARAGRLDAGVGRALPIAFFFLGALVGPWIRISLHTPRWIDLAGFVGAIVPAIWLISLRYALIGPNRLARVFAVLNLWQFGTLFVAIGARLHAHHLLGMAFGCELFALLLLVQQTRRASPGFLGGGERDPGALACLGPLAVALVLLGVTASTSLHQRASTLPQTKFLAVVSVLLEPSDVLRHCRDGLRR